MKSLILPVIYPMSMIWSKLHVVVCCITFLEEYMYIYILKKLVENS